MSGPVKFFRSSDFGAPTLNNTAGAFLNVMNACLLSGYGSKTLSTLVVSSGVATATVSTGHAFVNFGSTGIGPVLRIEGATPSEINGDKRITVVNSTTFTFPAAGVSDGAASGTITAKTAPADWECPFSGTNKAVFRQPYTFSNRRYLRIDDTGTSAARVRAYSYLEDVDGLNGTDLVPTDAQISGGGYITKANSATARAWFLAADDTSFLFNVFGSSIDQYNLSWQFGDALDLAKTGDAYATFLSTYSAFINPGGGGFSDLNGPLTYAFRAITQTGTSSTLYRGCRPTTQYGTIAQNNDSYPPSGDGIMLLWPLYLFDPTAKYRGRAPGVYGAFSYPGNNVYFTSVAEGPLANRAFISFNGNSSPGTAGALLDITGPWS